MVTSCSIPHIYTRITTLLMPKTITITIKMVKEWIKKSWGIYTFCSIDAAIQIRSDFMMVPAASRLWLVITTPLEDKEKFLSFKAPSLIFSTFKHDYKHWSVKLLCSMMRMIQSTTNAHNCHKISYIANIKNTLFFVLGVVAEQTI